MSFNVFKGQKQTNKQKKKKKNVEQEEIFDKFLVRSKFKQHFTCPKSTKSTTLTISFDISAVSCTGAGSSSILFYLI